mgnify:CR=1 FL=1
MTRPVVSRAFIFIRLRSFISFAGVFISLVGALAIVC